MRLQVLRRVITGIVIGCSSALAFAEAPAWLDSKWSTNPFWDDGKAEICVYDTTSPLNGKPRFHEFVTIVSAESPGQEPGSVPMFKLQMIAEQIDTGDYPFDYAASVYLDRANMARCIREIVTTHDWKGITVKQFDGVDAAPTLHAYGPHARQAAMDFPLEKDTIPLEAIPLLLRAMDFTTTASIISIPTLLTNRVDKPASLRLVAAKAGEGRVTVPAGKFDCLRIRVTTADGSKEMMSLWLEKAYPNRLIQKTTGNGKLFKLRRTERKELNPVQ